MKKNYIKAAGIINLFTALLHLIAGQMDLVRPLQQSGLDNQNKAEWLGVWHMVTILLFLTSYIILKAGFTKNETPSRQYLWPMGVYYLVACVPFIISSIVYQVLAPQWILLMPIGGLLLFGVSRKSDSELEVLL